ncbi:MAG: RecX family transcriptional regulator [Acidobacteria bacterium]|nr:RecX family transcriptional regulator [Acidobacteriota bacterium]
MAGTITALEIQKRNKERVNVYLDNEFALAVTVMAAASLRKGQFLNDGAINQLKAADDRAKAYDRAVRFLGFRPRSQNEVERYLQEKGYTPEVCVEVVNRLIEQKYLDDAEFVRFWLENREQFKPRGERALRYELRQKGIADSLIDAAVGEVNESDLAWAAVERKLYSWKNLPEPELKKKLAGFLSRRGFNYETVNEIMQRAKNSLNLSGTDTSFREE